MAQTPKQAHRPKSEPHTDTISIQAEPVLMHLEESLEVDPELLVDPRENEDYTPDEPVSKSGMQYRPKKDKVERMGTAPLAGLIMEFVVPSIISMVINGSYNVICGIFLGLQLGQEGLATATVAQPIMILSMAIGVLVGAGGNALAAIKLGEGKREAAERVIGNSLVLCIALGVICTVGVFVFIDPLLTLAGSTPQIHEQAKVFVLIVAAGFTLQFVGMTFNNFIRTAGSPSGALFTMLGGAITSVVLSYLFVMVFNWGVAGASLATVLGMLVTCVTVLAYFPLAKNVPFKLRRRNFAPSPRLMANICVLGSASFFLQGAAVVINLVLNNQVVVYGALDPIGSEGALAAIGVMQRIVIFAFFPILGVQVAIQPIFGYNYGAENYRRIKSTFKIALVWVMSFGVFFWLLVHLFPVQVVGIFGVHDKLHDFTINAVQVMMMLMPVVGLQVVVSGYFQATGQPIKSMFVSLTRQLLYLVPLILCLPLVVDWLMPGITPLQSIYYSYPIADALSILTAGGMMLYEWRRLARLQSASLQRKAIY